MDVDLLNPDGSPRSRIRFDADGSPGSRIRITPRSPGLQLPISFGSPPSEPDFDKLSKEATTLSEDLDDLRNKIRRMDVPKNSMDVQPIASQLVSSSNPALSTIASSVLNDKVNSIKFELLAETRDISRRLRTLEHKTSDLDRLRRTLESERDTLKQEIYHFLEMAMAQKLEAEIKKIREETADKDKTLEAEIKKIREETADKAQKLEAEIKKIREETADKDKTVEEKIETIQKELKEKLELKSEVIQKIKKDIEEVAKDRMTGSEKMKESGKSLEKSIEDYGKDDHRTLPAKRHHAKHLMDQQHYSEAEKIFLDIWKTRLVKDKDSKDLETIQAHHDYAITLQKLEKFGDAETNQRTVLKLATEHLQEDHPLTLEAKSKLALTLWEVGKYFDAQQMFEEVQKNYKAVDQDEMAGRMGKAIAACKENKKPDEEAKATAESSDSGRKHVMLSGRFTDEKIIKYIDQVKEFLEKEGIETYKVNSTTGEAFSGPTMYGMYHAHSMVVFGTSEYGQKTGARYETFWELQYAHEKDLLIIPLQLCDEWPPKPRDKDGGEEGKIQNDFVLRSSQLRHLDEKMENPQESAKKIAETLRKHQKDQKAGGKAKGAAQGATHNQDLSQQSLKEAQSHMEKKVEECEKKLKEHIQEVRDALDSEVKKDLDTLKQKTSKDLEEKDKKDEEKTKKQLDEFQAKLDSKAAITDTTRLSQELQSLETKVQEERKKREDLEKETKDHKTRLDPMGDKVTQIQRRTEEFIQRSSTDMEEERRKGREERDELRRQARDHQSRVDQEIRTNVQAAKEELQRSLGGKAAQQDLQDVKTDLISRLESKEQTLRQELRDKSKDFLDRNERTGQELQDRVSRVENYFQKLRQL